MLLLKDTPLYHFWWTILYMFQMNTKKFELITFIRLFIQSSKLIYQKNIVFITWGVSRTRFCMMPLNDLELRNIHPNIYEIIPNMIMLRDETISILSDISLFHNSYQNEVFINHQPKSNQPHYKDEFIPNHLLEMIG